MYKNKFLFALTFIITPLSAEIADDISCLNKTKVQAIVYPKTVTELQAIIKTQKGPFSIAGARCSQGGQTIAQNGIVIDMRYLNKIIALDTQQKTVTVQTGTTWREIQKEIDPHNLSIKVMQSYCDFSVGGSLSVNAHGRYVGHGPLIETVKEIKIITHDGQLKTASRTCNKDLFRGAIGGYGGLGVIVEATLELTDNQKIEQRCALVPVEDYFDFFKIIQRDNTAILHNGDLHPPHYNKVLCSTWHSTKKPLTTIDRLKPEPTKDLFEIIKLSAVRRFFISKEIRASIIAPKSLTKREVVWRNYEAGHGIKELYCPQYFSTDLLQEYFIPQEHAADFAKEMADIFKKRSVNVINVSIRHVAPNEESILSWSFQEEAFAFVIYYEQMKFQNKLDQAETWTRELINIALKYKGRFYLPYQKYATQAQFEEAYPGASFYRELKKQYDPNNIFKNALLDKYINL